ncbi:MAG: tRNA adenosine(34) deaminase TadA [Oscillospiraceae bacterium]|nr:tRNA adenosine(34) deaminase TadA [Oscillospiraceae bacterium]
MKRDDEYYMKVALRQAAKAMSEEEVPIGAVIVKDGIIVGRGHNRREAVNDATAHAEMAAIRQACRRLSSWRLVGCELYVTLEPCPMCAGAIVLARIERVVFGAWDLKAGAYGSVMDIAQNPSLNHHPIITTGVLMDQCSGVLTDFFRHLRT